MFAPPVLTNSMYLYISKYIHTKGTYKCHTLTNQWPTKSNHVPFKKIFCNPWYFVQIYNKTHFATIVEPISLQMLNLLL
jgi:hypothetical protein